MKKKILSLLISASMIAGILSGCGTSAGEVTDATDAAEETTETEEGALTEAAAKDTADLSTVKSLDRPGLIGDLEEDEYELTITPSIPAYSVEGDFDNVINAEDEMYGDYISDAFKEKLKDNLFVVGEENGNEFWETYEFNAYSLTPNFVTVDSLMHTYHIYFAHLLKGIEKSYLSDAICSMSGALYEESLSQYEELKGSEWEEAAARNVEFFAVAENLMGENAEVPDFAKEAVTDETQKILKAEGIEPSHIITTIQEDYSQYKPRGYYENDEELQKYFRTMMWYGRMTFTAEDESNTRSAVLMSLAMKNAGLKEWESVYAVTSFFAGASDDLGYCEYMPLIEAAYGKNVTAAELTDNETAWESVYKRISELDAPRIQSVPVYDDEENVVPGFRLMGQRFTIDGNIMQNLIYRAVGENDNEERRMLPNVLDVPAALGSDAAKNITMDAGASKWADYETNLEKLREDLASSPESIWTSNLSSQWLDTLKPLLDEKGEGYPSFMQSDEWTKKTLETFAGSYTELKHDTVLYAKQPMAEMGGGDLEPVDDRGYVEPEPVLYARFTNLARATQEGLKKYNMLSAEDGKNLDLLTELSGQLLSIAEKELKNELPSDDEFELIRNYGGNIEHFWYEAMKDDADEEYFTAEEYPAALIVDVATDPNGCCLEAGLGNPREIYVIVPVDGILRIATGSVYNYYEFEWPLEDRLTDSDWRTMCGADPGEGYLYERDDSIVNPEWTMSYRENKWNGEW